MLRKLINIFNQNEVAKIFDFALINNEPQEIDFGKLAQAKDFLGTDNAKNLIKELETGWNSSKYIKRLKYLLATHYLLMSTPKAEELAKTCRRFAHPKNQQSHNVTLSKSQSQHEWIETNLVNYYSQYLQKLSTNFDLYWESRRLPEVTIGDLQSLQLTAGGFKLINLLNFILKMQVNLNKIGRYYPQLKVMGQLYSMYARDIKVIYHRLQLITEGILENYKRISPEMLRHSFIFITQSQKELDRLAEFFHNRYFYRSADVGFPHVEQIDPKKYKELLKYVRSVDKTIEVQRVVPNTASKRKTLLEINRMFSEMTIHDFSQRQEADMGATETTSFVSEQKTFEERFRLMKDIARDNRQKRLRSANKF